MIGGSGVPGSRRRGMNLIFLEEFEILIHRNRWNQRPERRDMLRTYHGLVRRRIRNP